MDAHPRHRPARIDRISSVLGELARTLRAEATLIDELDGLDRRLDRVLVYRDAPNANEGLAWAYLDLTLDRRASTVARLKANRAKARRLLLATDRLMESE